MNVPWVRHLRRSPGVRSLNFFQGMPFVSAVADVSFRDFECICVPCALLRGDTRLAIARHSRLILFAFRVERARRAKLPTAHDAAIRLCIRVLARFCSASDQGCTGGSDLVCTVTNLQQASRASTTLTGRSEGCARRSALGESHDSPTPRACRSVEQGMTLFHTLRGGSN